MIAFTMIEKRPMVNILMGKLMILRIGFKISDISASTIEPIRRVINPPLIVNPGTICGIK